LYPHHAPRISLEIPFGQLLLKLLNNSFIFVVIVHVRAHEHSIICWRIAAKVGSQFQFLSNAGAAHPDFREDTRAPQVFGVGSSRSSAATPKIQKGPGRDPLKMVAGARNHLNLLLTANVTL
jgi:hypothetical protein